MALAIVLCFSLCVPAFASEYNVVPDYLCDFIENRNPDATISQIVPMYDTEQNVVAWLYILSPSGYVITDSSKEIVVEFSFSKIFEYNGEVLYFAGPTQYFTKTDSSYRSIESELTITEEELETKTNTFSSLTEEMITTQNMPISMYSEVATASAAAMDKDEFPLYDYNEDGRCGSVAAAILLAYYNNNGYSGLVSDTYYNNDVLFTNYLYNHIEGLDSTSGSSTSDLVSGLNWYLQQKGFSSKLAAYSLSNGSFSNYTGKIDAGTPVILDLNEHPTYSEHWVVGYGYDYDQFIISYNQFAIVNDGWGNNEIEINWTYVCDFVYLK